MGVLRLCRFCKGIPRVNVAQKDIVSGEYVSDCYVECMACKARTRSFKNIQDAVDCWNSANEGVDNGTRDERRQK